MPSKTIKVFVVDDSSLFRKMIIDYLSSCPDMHLTLMTPAKKSRF